MWGYSGWGSARWAEGSTLAGSSYSPGNATITFTGYGPSLDYIFPGDRVSWIGLEVLHPGVQLGRVSWIGVEVLHPSDAQLARLSWIGVEVLRSIEIAVESAGGVNILW